MFGAERRVIGLDLGAASVKVAHVRAGKQGPEIIGAGVARLPEGALGETGVADPELAAGAIREALAEAKVGRSTRQAVAGVPGKYLSVRVLSVPTMDHSELREAIKWEAAQYLPYPPEEGVFDFIELGPGSTSGTLEVVSISARKTVVEGLIRTVELAGLEPVALDAVPLALGRVFVPEPDEYPGAALPLAAATSESVGDEAVAVADIGAATTEVSIFRRGRLRVSRSIPIAGARFTAALAEALGLSPTAAEETKLKEGRLDLTGETDTRPGYISQVLRQVADELADEVQRSLDYFRAQSHWLPVSHVQLTGEGARLRGLAQFLSEHLGLKVVAGGAAAALPLEVGQAVAGAGVSPVALGLALWEVNRA